jgi:hypothetical protein
MTIRSGWLPAAAVVVIGGILAVTVGQVATLDVIRFLFYLAGWIVLPGTLAWRWLGLRRAPRPVGEDIAVGALVGYVLEFPVYLGALAVGHPQLYLLWPLVAVLITLATPARRQIWTRRGPRMSLAWSWTVSAGAVYVLGWFATTVWAKAPLTQASLDSPYIDEPYHLSLATSLMHYFPPRVTYVDGAPLRYHWLSHLHVAAASWVSGDEPIVVLHSLAMPTVIVICAVALSFIAVRLSGAPWTGMATMAALLVSPANFSGWTDGHAGQDLLTERLLAHRLVDSPSAAFVNAALLLGVLLVIELLRGTARGVVVWALTALTMLAMVGAKSSSLPTVAAGLVAATLMAFVLRSPSRRVPLLLSVVAIGCFVIATLTFFRGSQQGTSLDPLHLVSQNGQVTGIGEVLAATRILGLLTTGAGLFLWLARRGWRQPDRVFLVLLCLSGIGAGLTFGQDGLSEYYFVYVVFAPMILGGVLGLHAAWEALPAHLRRPAGAAVGVAVAAALVGGLAIGWIDRASSMTPTGNDAGWAARVVVAPMATAIAVVAIGTGLGCAAFRMRGHRLVGGLAGLVAVAAFAGIGLAPTTASAVGDPDAPRPVSAPEIGQDGIATARWLRDHSSTSDVVATNAHCSSPGVEPCAAANFWMAGYSERQFLVSGWAYVVWGILGIKDPPPGAGTAMGPFWNPQLLTLNDRAFLHPSVKALRRLERHGVDLLFVDRRYPVDLPALERVAQVVHQDGDYVVLTVPRPAS